MDPGKEIMMFAVIRERNQYPETQKSAALDARERGFDLVYSDKVRLVRRTVARDVGLPG